MDFSVDITSNLPSKDYIIAFGHLKLIRDKSNNAKAKTILNESKKKSAAIKLPRNTKCNMSKKDITNTNVQNDTSGDTAGPSKRTNSKITLDHSGEEKYKQILISRRKSNSREIPTREPTASSITNITNKVKANNQPRNVQRVQLLNINPDFCREIRSPPKSLVTARPIPTLGQIYRQDLSDDTFSDWHLGSFGEYSNSFDNSVETNSTSSGYDASTCISNNNNNVNQEINFNNDNLTHMSLITKKTTPVTTFKTTDENVSEWLSAELDHPTRDNEASFRSMRSPSKISLKICQNLDPNRSNEREDKCNTVQDTSKLSSTKVTEIKSGSDPFVKEQPTIVIKKKIDPNNTEPVFAIPKTNTDVKEKDYYPDFHKPLKYHSTPNAPRKRDAIHKNPAASYVEYPSEVLQRTTNFESDGCDNLSSIIETDHVLSSSWKFKRTADSDSTFNGLTWSKMQISQETFRQASRNNRSWKSDGCDNKLSIVDSDKYSSHDYCYHYCWRKEVAKKETDEQSLRDYRGRCNKCHKYRRSPKKKGPFIYLRKRMNGICRHRLKRVWKKTTEKWANWSKSPSKFRRSGMMNYLQKSIIWDNANVQTTIFVYHETGTDAVAREQKSAEITASLKPSACSSYKNDTPVGIVRSVRSQIRQGHPGPSMFPFLRYSSNNTVVFGRYQSKPSSRDELGAGAVKEIRSINTQCSYLGQTALEGEITQKLNRCGNIKHALSQDAYTQAIITCNNADTNVMFTPADQQMNPTFSQELLYYGVDSATDPIPIDKISQRSMNVMTSNEILKSLIHNGTQVSPSVSIWKCSTGVLGPEMYRDNKSSVVTDTSVPCRRLDTTYVMTNGRVLSCTGTKITSVSSADIQTASIVSNVSRPYTVNTAISTIANIRHTDCSTAPSLYKRQVEDVSLETDSFEAATIEKSTSKTYLGLYSDAGVSAGSVVKRSSFNCGSPHIQCSFGAAIQPEYTSAVVSTNVRPVTEWTSVQGMDHDICDCKVTNACHTQYSDFIKNGSSSAGGCHIGRSRLISVRALLSDAADDATQAQPNRCSAETRTSSTNRISASMFTSGIALGDPQQCLELTLDKDQNPVLNGSAIRSDDSNNIVASNAMVAATTVTQVSNKPSARSDPSVCNVASLGARSQTASVILSSRLNASEWITVSAKENNDVQSILRVSECAVRESLQRAELIANSSHKLSSSDIQKLSKVILNPKQDTTPDSATAKSYDAVSTNRFKNIPTFETNNSIELNLKTKKDSSHSLTVDKMTSDEVVVKDVKESILQVQANVCDTVPASTKKSTSKSSSKFSIVLKWDRIYDTTCCLQAHKSAGVLTSRHVLPRSARCGANCGRDTECLFVYDRPRCVVHNNCVDVAVQIHPRKEKIRPNTSSSSQRSIGIETSLPCQGCCQRNSEVIGEILSPRVYRSLYEATKHIKDGLESSSRNSSNSAGSDKAVENYDANRVTSQMTSCLGNVPAHCCCMRCIQIGNTDTRSIQAVKNSSPLRPNCNTKVDDLQKNNSDKIEECTRSHLASCCRYYSNLLTMKLGRFRENFIEHLAPSIVESIYPMDLDELYTEACTMKPSGRQDEICQAKIPTYKMSNPITGSCILSPTISATDVRGYERQDLRSVYYILSGIEGRVRRLKNNLHN